MLVLDPKHRLTCPEVLKHAWFTKFGPSTKVTKEEDDLDVDIYHKMKSYNTTSYF